MHPRAETDRGQRWQERLLASLRQRMAGGTSALCLVRIGASRPGGAPLSLIEQEGILSRAQACAAVLAIAADVEPLSLNSFGIVFSSVPSAPILIEISAQLRREIEKDLRADTAFEIQVTMGVAVFPQHALDPLHLLEAADAALGSADPEAPVTLYSYEAREAAKARDAMATRLRYAIEREELCLHYQPQLDPRTGRARTVESLVRWQLDGKLLSPGQFFDLASDVFYVGLGEWTLREAVRQIMEWRAAGIPMQRVAVNLVAQQLRQGDFLDLVRSTLERAGLEAQGLELELTETHLVEHLEQCGDAFERLRASGVRIAIDDFGTGYSSLSYLKHLPMDTLKIDRSLTTDVVTNPIDRTVISSVCELAKGLQLTSVAEGVEREDQYLQLASLGCDRLQGYWIAKPQGSDALASWVKSRDLAR